MQASDHELERGYSVKLSLDARYEKDPNVVSRGIAGEQILVPVRKKAADMAAVYVLNEVGARIWELVDGQRSLADIRTVLLQEYVAQPERIESDVVEIVVQLEELGMLRAVGHGV
jgi:hypothetical protein